MSKDKKRKLFPNGILNSGAFSLLKGLIGTSNPIVATGVGIVEGVVNRFKNIPKKNKASKVSGEGKTDWYEWIGIAAAVFALGYGVYQVLTGEISIGEFMDINKG